MLTPRQKEGDSMSLAGERIRHARIINHLTQDDVAKCLGIGKQAVYKYEIGTVTNIPLENLEKMAVLFHTTPAYLAGWSDDGAPIAPLSSDEQFVMDTYRSLSDPGKQYIHQQLTIASHMFGGKSENADQANHG